MIIGAAVSKEIGRTEEAKAEEAGTREVAHPGRRRPVVVVEGIMKALPTLAPAAASRRAVAPVAAQTLRLIRDGCRCCGCC